MRDSTTDTANLGTTRLLDAILDRAISEGQADARISLGQIIDGLEERAFGIVILLLALPCCLPFVYGLPQVVALPMLFLSAQMAFGRRSLWLPEKLRVRSFLVSSLRDVINRGRRLIGWFEALSHPRLLPLSSQTGSRIVGALLLIPSASVLVPLPLTNTVPGFGVAVAAVGLVERDGWVILLGLFIGLVWVAALLIGGQAAIHWLIGFVR